MSQRALVLSTLLQDSASLSKLFRIGLKSVPVIHSSQSFPLDATLPAIPYCFGGYLPNSTARQYDEVVVAARPIVQDPGTKQPTWGAIGTETQLTIADFFRNGTCYEDEEHPVK